MAEVLKRFNDNPELQTVADSDIFPVEKMSNETDGKVTFDTLNKQILHNAEVSCSVDEENAQLTVALKDNDGETISTKTVDLPNTGTIDCEVDEDTAELTVQLKNTKGEVVTSDTVTLPNTSDVECELSETNELTVSLKDKSGEVVTSDSVQLESGKVDSLTQSEYDALSEAEKTNGQIREITDAEGEPVPFAVMNDELTTTSNVLSAQETENRINSLKTYIKNQNVLSDYESFQITTTDTEVQFDGVINFSSWTNSSKQDYYVNDVIVGKSNTTGSQNPGPLTLLVNKGDRVKYSGGLEAPDSVYARWYKLRDYTNR